MDVEYARSHALLCIFKSAGNFCHFHKNDGQQNNKQWIDDDDGDGDADDDGDDSTKCIRLRLIVTAPKRTSL